MEIKYSERMDAFGTSIVRELFKLLKDPDIISFAGGEPATDLYPLEEYKLASSKALDEYGITALSYDSTEGFMPLREIIAKERMSKVGVEAKAEDIIVTNGSQQGIDFSARLFIDKDDVVICEGPTYLAAINSFNAFMGKTVQVPMDDEGMIIEELEKAIIENPKVKFIYTIPDFQNPTGITMSLERRKKLVEIAEKYNIPVIEDNPYVDLRIEGERLPSIKSFDTKGIVVYLGSFSKICVPGVRLGWICASQELLSQYVKLKQVSDLQPCTVAQRELTKYMQMNNVDEHINKLAPFYSKRRDAMLESIKREFPKSVSYTEPKGGFFIWVTLPKHIDTTELFKKSVEQEKVAFVPGAPFFINDGNENYMRLSYSKVPEDKIVEGIKRLGKMLKSLEQKSYV